MENPALETATFAGGCFWCLEAVFEPLAGVVLVVPGYTGGHVKNPGYHEVCTGATGHAEAVQITFDPAQIGYADLLELLFAFHDPTTLNRQGADVGTQYRSAIFFHSPGQERLARAAIAAHEAAKTWPDPIVTEVVPCGAFHPAEAYHQEYFRRNGGQPYCRAVIAPKVRKLREHYAARLRPTASA